MNLTVPQGPLDEASRRDGDRFFRGIDERVHPTQLTEGWLSRGANLRCGEGVAEPRRGIALCPWGPTDGVTAFDTVFAATVFYDATDGVDWIVLADADGVWRTAPHQIAQSVTLPAGVTLTRETCRQFVVCRHTLVLLRGPDESPLQCTDLDAGFSTVTPSADGDGTEPIPNASFGIYFANRLIVIFGRDQIAVSDEGDVTRYSSAVAAFQINEGDNDELVALAAFDASTLLFLKRNSVWKVTNISGNLAAAVGPLLVTDQYGCVAPESVVRVGLDLWWWSDQGLVGLKLTEQNELQGREDRLTDPLPVTLRRLHRRYQDRIRCAYHDGLVYVAVPLDDAEILGEDLATGSYAAGSSTVTGLTVGAAYRYTQGASEAWNDNSQTAGTLASGASTYTASTQFTAEATTATLTTPNGLALSVTATVQAILHAGVLNGVLVYDTRMGAWVSAADEANATRVAAWFRLDWLGAERLFFASTDGWIRLYDDGCEDEEMQTVATPYADVLVTSEPALGDTIQVNGGTLATNSVLTVNTGSDWGAFSVKWARANLWRDGLGDGGYDPTAAGPLGGPWTAPNTTPTQIAWGVRFTATNGVLPVVTIGGAWAFVDEHSGSEITRVPITTSWTTRGYTCQEPDRNRYTSLLALLSTWNATYTLTTLFDGVGRETVHLAAVTASRTVNAATFDGSAWDTANTGDDHGAEGRGDYSVILPDTGMNLDPTGVNFELHQDGPERVPVSEQGHWCQLKLSNTTGRCVLRGTVMEALDGDRAAGKRTS